ncbi:hypothetical protein [Sorangium sp. So ce1335]|uniref:hypothetical protein n=1 Tax=Sorangium sp. So ce1335 TaxID=3133335 RepID=UPI003F5F6247
MTVACVGAEIDDGSEEFTEEAQDAVVSENGFVPNALGPNALAPNALAPNALAPNALAPNALAPNALAPNALAAIKHPGPSGAMSRELLRYVVSCALRPDQTFSFSWNDSSGAVRQETYRGEIGLAPWWVYSVISEHYQRHITACLAARTNWYGVNVMISLRNLENGMGASEPELTAYRVREGAFWGNVFSSTPFVRACYSPEGVARARQLQRDCAAGHLSVDPVTGATTTQTCGAIVIAGSCDTVCNWTDSAGKFYKGCIDNASVSPWIRTDLVVTSFLPGAP